MSSLKIRKTDFEEVYDKYSDLLYRLALSHIGNAHDAGDTVHDVFATYIEKSYTFKDDEHERAWFVRVTVNRCHDFLRKQKHRNHLSLDDIRSLSENENSNLPMILVSIGDLSEKYKTVIVLHYLEGYSIGEISSMLSISVSAVKMRLSRGKEFLKKQLEKEEDYV